MLMRLWDLQGKLIVNMMLPQSPSAQMDSTSSVAVMMGPVGLWDFQGNPIGQLFREHADMITSVAFSTNGQYIISGSRDGTVWLRLGGNWETWLQVVCDRLRYHPVFKNPESEVAKEACEVCRKYVWKE
jgi:hypothetical protein